MIESKSNLAEKKYDFGSSGLQLKTQLSNQDWGAVAAAGRIERIINAKPRYTLLGVTMLLFPIGQSDSTFGVVFSYQGLAALQIPSPAL